MRFHMLLSSPPPPELEAALMCLDARGHRTSCTSPHLTSPFPLPLTDESLFNCFTFAHPQRTPPPPHRTAQARGEYDEAEALFTRALQVDEVIVLGMGFRSDTLVWPLRGDLRVSGLTISYSDKREGCDIIRLK